MDKLDKKVLLTGSSGFLGLNLTKELIRKRYKVYCVYNTKLKKKYNNVKYIKCNLENYNEIKKKLKNIKFKYVINLAGYGIHDDFTKGGSKIIFNHFLIAMNLANYFLNKKISKFINIGSADEYGKNKHPQKENMKEDPLSSYSFVKISNTYLFQMLHKKYNFPSVTLRPFLVYGPYQETNRLIPYVIKSCIKNKSFNITEGGQFRDFCYVDDFSNAVIKCLNTKKVNGEVINIASGKKIQIKSVVKIINSKIKLGKPLFGKKEMRKEENYSLYANIEKAKKLIKWRPKIDINNGLDFTIKHYLKNE